MTADVEGVAREVAADAAVSRAMAPTPGPTRADRVAVRRREGRARSPAGGRRRPRGHDLRHERRAARAGRAARRICRPIAPRGRPPCSSRPRRSACASSTCEPIPSSASDPARSARSRSSTSSLPRRRPRSLLTTSEYVMPTKRAPVLAAPARCRGGPASARPSAFVVPAADGTPLVDASIAPSDAPRPRACDASVRRRSRSRSSA